MGEYPPLEVNRVFVGSYWGPICWREGWVTLAAGDSGDFTSDVLSWASTLWGRGSGRHPRGMQPRDDKPVWRLFVVKELWGGSQGVLFGRYGGICCEGAG